MYQGRVQLTCQDILEKRFSVDTRGFRPQEVDSYLDKIISDYHEMNKIISELQEEKKTLEEENIQLKQEIRNLRMKIETLKDMSSNEGTNVDVLKRLSNLEKIIYGKE